MVQFEQAVSDQLCAIKNILNQADIRATKIISITVPETPTFAATGRRAFSTGSTTINYRTGTITNPNGTIETPKLSYSLESYIRELRREVNLRSLTIDTDQDIVLTVRGQPEWKWYIDAGHRELPGYIEFQEIVITTNQTTNIKIFVCTNPQASIFNFTKASEITTLTIDDDKFTIQDETDRTKQIMFDIGTNIPTGTTKILRAPNATGDISLKDNTETMTNKTMTTPVLNNPTANGINYGVLALADADFTGAPPVYTVATTVRFVVITLSSKDVTLYLPAASTKQNYLILRTDATAWTLTINEISYNLTGAESWVEAQSDGSGYHIVNKNVAAAPVNVLSRDAIIPTQDTWGTAPTSLSNTTDGNPTTSTGTGSKTITTAGEVYGNIIFDRGANWSGPITVGARVALWSTDSTVAVTILESSDGSTFPANAVKVAQRTATTEGTHINTGTMIVTTRYFKLSFSAVTTDGSTTCYAIIDEVYGWQMG